MPRPLDGTETQLPLPRYALAEASASLNLNVAIPDATLTVGSLNCDSSGAALFPPLCTRTTVV